MSLNIKNAETERLVRRLAAETGESVTSAVTEAVREKLDRLEVMSRAAAAARAARMRRIAADSAPRWAEPYRSKEHGELLYDEHGLPR